MKKYIFFSLLLFFSAYSLYSQDKKVGINTGSPEGPLHIKSKTLLDGKGVLIDSDNDSGITVAIDDTKHNSASVSLGAADKAFLPNRVALTGAEGDAPGNPIKNPVEGMVVYNTARAGKVPNNVVPGLYVFKSNRWMYCITEEPGINIQSYTLGSPLSLSPNRNLNYDRITEYLTLSLLPDKSTTSSNYVDIWTNAAYGVTLSLSGSISYLPTGYNKMRLYVAIVKLNDDGTAVSKVLDAATIIPIAFAQDEREGGATYSLTMGFEAQKGDKISIRIASQAGSTWTLNKDETKIVFFKI